MNDRSDYWKECLQISAGECGVTLTAEQADYIAGDLASSHENYGMAFYSPPSTDRLADIERGWQAKYDALKAEFDKYRNNAETAVRRALKQHSDANVTIGEHGEVTRWGGRAEQIQ